MSAIFFLMVSTFRQFHGLLAGGPLVMQGHEGGGVLELEEVDHDKGPILFATEKRGGPFRAREYGVGDVHAASPLVTLR